MKKYLITYSVDKKIYYKEYNNLVACWWFETDNNLFCSYYRFNKQTNKYIPIYSNGKKKKNRDELDKKNIIFGE